MIKFGFTFDAPQIPASNNAAEHTTRQEFNPDLVSQNELNCIEQAGPSSSHARNSYAGPSSHGIHLGYPKPRKSTLSFPSRRLHASHEVSLGSSSTAHMTTQRRRGLDLATEFRPEVLADSAATPVDHSGNLGWTRQVHFGDSHQPTIITPAAPRLDTSESSSG